MYLRSFTGPSVPYDHWLDQLTKTGHFTSLRRLFASEPGQLDPGRDITVRDTPRTDPDGRLLAHPVLIADEWRQSEPRGKDGALAVEETIGLPRQEYASRRSGVSGCGGEGCATTAQLTDPGRRRDCRGFPVPRSS